MSELKELEYRISLPHETEKTTVIGRASIQWNKCVVFTDGTKKYIKYFKSKLNANGKRVALRQTYTTFLHEGETRAFRTTVMTYPETKEVIHFARGARDCRIMIFDFNMLGIKLNKTLT